MEFIWNSEYIAQHTLDNHIITDSGIKLLNEDEIFVEHQDFSRYFISQYGRAISLKRKQPQLLRESIQGTRENQYPAFGIGINGQSMITGRAVAEIFCPNFWNRFKRMPNIYNSALEAHHCDKNHFNNHYLNLVLLPVWLHHDAHKIDSYALWSGTEINEYLNPLRIVEATNMDLELEDITCAGWNRKGKSSDTGYTIYKIDHYWIGLKFADKITA